jgi:hypothetical protein
MMIDLAADLPKIASVFALAFFSFVPSIPAGLALGLPPLIAFMTSALSYAVAAVLMVVLGERAREWVKRRLGGKNFGDPNSRIYKVWERYGVIGLGLLAPLTVGAQIGVILGLTLNAKPRPLLLWMVIGGVVVGAALTALLAINPLATAPPSL